jgi:hypothetical protein
VKRTCLNCDNYQIEHDRHGFDSGPYEDNSFCRLAQQDPDFDAGLTPEQLKAADDGELGWSVDCPRWNGADRVA